MLKSFMVAIKNFQVILKLSPSFFHGVPTNCLFLVTLTGPTCSLRNSIFWGYSSPLLDSAAKNILTHDQQKSKSMFILWSGYWAWDACSREISTGRTEGYLGSIVCMGGELETTWMYNNRDWIKSSRCIWWSRVQRSQVCLHGITGKDLQIVLLS